MTLWTPQSRSTTICTTAPVINPPSHLVPCHRTGVVQGDRSLRKAVGCTPKSRHGATRQAHVRTAAQAIGARARLPKPENPPKRGPSLAVNDGFTSRLTGTSKMSRGGCACGLCGSQREVASSLLAQLAWGNMSSSKHLMTAVSALSCPSCVSRPVLAGCYNLGHRSFTLVDRPRETCDTCRPAMQKAEFLSSF